MSYNCKQYRNVVWLYDSLCIVIPTQTEAGVTTVTEINDSRASLAVKNKNGTNWELEICRN